MAIFSKKGLFFSEKGLVFSEKIAILGQITPFTATHNTLLPPLLPPLNFLIIRIIYPKMAVVAVKMQNT